jgi:AAA domain
MNAALLVCKLSRLHSLLTATQAQGAQSLVLVGDQQQLPPTVRTREALDLGLAESLFARMLRAGLPAFLLDTQYRMHPSISAFPSQVFYGGRMRDGVAARDRPRPAALAWPRADMPVVLVPCRFAPHQASSLAVHLLCVFTLAHACS